MEIVARARSPRHRRCQYRVPPEGTAGPPSHWVRLTYAGRVIHEHPAAGRLGGAGRVSSTSDARPLNGASRPSDGDAPQLEVPLLSELRDRLDVLFAAQRDTMSWARKAIASLVELALAAHAGEQQPPRLRRPEEAGPPQ
jgi:hypothetical protein